MQKYNPVIGLEIHTQVKTVSKMFCGCPTNVFGKDPNTATCPVCLGLPGAMPVPNRLALEKTVVLAKALGCRIAKFSQFERKNYFYPDLPKGFQISQFAFPVGEIGKFEGMTIRRVHLEEDAGRLLHEGSATLVDFNRSGIPLIEIVTEPEFSDPAGVSQFLKELRTLLVHLDISDADMEKGSLRLEANISLRHEGKKELPLYKVELKNINSFAFLEKAIRSEISRQSELLSKGEKVAQETRGWDEKKMATFSQRKKEEAFDYRYFPEPDIPPLTETVLVTAEKYETPAEKRNKYIAFGVPANYVEVFLKDKELTMIFEDLQKEINPQEAANIIVNKRFGDPKKLGGEGILAAYRAKSKMEFITGEEFNSALEKVLLDNQEAVSDYKSGKTNALQFLLGQLMKETKGKIKAEEGLTSLKEKINARS